MHLRRVTVAAERPLLGGVARALWQAHVRRRRFRASGGYRVTPAEQLNPYYWTPERIAKIRRASPRTFAMHVQNQWGGVQNAALDYEDVIAARRTSVPEYYRAGRGMLAIDPSSLAGDAWAWSGLCWL